MKHNNNNKKGEMLGFDKVITIMGIIMLIGIGLLFSGKMIESFDDTIQNNSNIDNRSKEVSDNFNNSIVSGVDVVTILLLIISLIVISIYLRSIIFTNIKFFIVLLFLVITPFLGYIFQIIWSNFATATAFSTILTKIPITNYILENLGIVLLIYSFILGVVLFTNENRGN